MAYIAPYIDENGVHVPSFSDIQDNLISQAKSIFGQDIYLDSDSQDMQWISAVSKSIYDCMQSILLTISNQSPQTSYGKPLDSLVKINGLERLSATYSTVQITCIGTSGIDITIAAGVVQDTAGYKWDLPENSVIPAAGVLSVMATCETEGAITCDIGAIQTIVTPQYGWDSVSNAAAANVGSPVETDTALRKRQSASVMLPSLSIVDGILAAVETLSGVTRARNYENDTSSTDSNGIPAHSIAVVVENGDDTEIAQTIATTKGPGCGTYGSTSVSLPSEYSVKGAVNFSHPSEISVSVNIVIVQLNSEYTQTVQTELITNIENYLNSLKIGASVQASSLYYPALSSMANQVNPSFRISSLTINKDGTGTATVTTQTQGSANLVVSSVSEVSVGMVVVGAGIPDGTTITAIDSGSLTLTLSNAATEAASSGTVTFYTDTISIAWNEVSKAGTITIAGGL